MTAPGIHPEQRQKNYLTAKELIPITEHITPAYFNRADIVTVTIISPQRN